MKKVISLVLAVAMVLTVAIPLFASAAPKTAVVEGFAFHCNAISGNGRTYIEGKDDDFGKKMNINLTLNDNDPTGKTWDVDNKTWVCRTCGSSVWVSYSNKSGVPDGKNIQLQHPGENNKIVKEWIKNKPAADYIGVKFFANFLITLTNGKTFKVGPGNFFLPSDLTVKSIKEIACTDGFECVKEKVSDCGKIFTFVNEDDKPEIISSKYYYAACQLYHDILYKLNSSSLDPSFYGQAFIDMIIPFGGIDNWAGAILHPVGLDHRDAIQDYYERNRVEEDVRYDPLPFTSKDADDLRVYWEEQITDALIKVCTILGIDWDAFFEEYGLDSVAVQTKYHAGQQELITR